MSTLAQASWISLIGMGLTFLGIIVLWGLMVLLVHIFADRKQDLPDTVPVSEKGFDELQHKRQAAAAAVAYMMQLQTTSISLSTHKEREMISAWQAAHRSHKMYTNSLILPKKNRGK